MSCTIDHLVIAAPSLAAGTKMLREALGIWPQPGGEHPRMGTHNALLRLGEQIYVEVIAVNPSMAKPNRPRWFGLDQLTAQSVPRLTTWVARCDDIHASHAACGGIHGEVLAMSRGELNWLISIPDDGGMPFDGVAPSLIQWQTAPHPARRLEDRGCNLVALKGAHPKAPQLNEILGKLAIRSEILVCAGAAPQLIAQINTPSGIKTIGP